MPPPVDGTAAASTTCRVREVLTSHRKISADIHHRIKHQTLTEEEDKVHRDGLGEGLLVKRGGSGVVNGNNKQKLKN